MREHERKLKEIGDYESVKTFLGEVANVKTKVAHAIYLACYLRWLRSVGIIRGKRPNLVGTHPLQGGKTGSRPRPLLPPSGISPSFVDSIPS